MKKRKRDEKFIFKKEYKETWTYLKKSKNYIWAIVGLFIFFGLLGFFIPLPEEISKLLMEFIRELLDKTVGMNQAEITGFIFFNNLKASFLGMVLGIFLGIPSLIITLSNGYIVGFVSSVAVQAGGPSVLWSLVPHGIFELPAVFISLGLGIRLGFFVFKKQRKNSFKKEILESLRVFLLIVIPLLIIAAIIEGLLIALS